MSLTLLGSETIPLYRFGLVLWDAKAMGIHKAKITLRMSHSLLGSKAEPLYRFTIVLRYTFPAK